MKVFNSVVNYFTFKKSRAYALVFIIAVGFFGYLHTDPTFADPDSFYHVKATQFLVEKGAITEFPWLNNTSLKYSFTDHHFFYHLLLVPFIYLLPPLAGIKVATVFFASLTITFFYWLLTHLKVRGALWYALFLLTVNPFIFRIGLAKAQGLAILFLFLIIYLIFSRRYMALILASCFYVWLYAGWPLVVALASIYAFMSAVWPNKKKLWGALQWRRTKSLKQGALLVSSAVIGVAAGVFFSPYFPGNLDFYYQQIFKIALVNYQYLIGVGGEWYPYDISSLFRDAMLFFGLGFIGLVAFIFSYKKQSVHSWFFFILSFLFFILTLKSRRYVEYFVPVTVFFSAISITGFWRLYEKDILGKVKKQHLVMAPIIILLAVSPIIFKDVLSVKNFYRDSFSFDKFSQASSWLKENSQKGDIVFHSDWDEFPILFYHNDHNYYLVGLDPTFMYNHNKELHKSWVDITLGENADTMYETIKDVFDAKYVFVDIKQNVAFDKNLANNFYFEVVFENEESKVYKVVE